MTLPPWGVHTAEAQTAPTFEQVFDGRSLPTFFADVDGDGKQEYVMENPHQWRSLSGQKVMPMPDDMYVSWFDWSMLQLNAEPWPAFARFQRNSYDSFGDVVIFRNGKYQHDASLYPMKNCVGGTWADINLDGRMDMLYWQNESKSYKGKRYVPYVMMQRADGTFTRQPFLVVTDPDELRNAEYAAGGNGTFSVSTGNAFSGFASADNGGFSTGPMTVVDFNQDGYPDFIDKDGNSYISLGDGRYYQASIKGDVHSADVNGDGLTDLLLYYNGQLTLKLNHGNGFTDTDLLTNYNLKGVHVLDCDGDGLLDILVTLAAEDASYLAFFRNQGNGTFKRTVRSFTGYHNWQEPCFVNNNGRPSMISLATQYGGDQSRVICWNWDASFRVDTVALNPTRSHACSMPVKDMDGDGKVDILCEMNDQKGLLHCAVDKANTPPAKMAKPRLALDKSTGMLRVEWAPGSDAENAVGDLTYELEITSADGRYLFRAVTKSLFSMAAAGSWGEPSVQVRVRAVDACGMKGEWSDKTVQSDILQVPSFALSHTAMSGCDTLFVDVLNGAECVMRGLPDGTLVTAADGRKGILFASHGKKTVELTSADGLTARREVDVMPLRVTEFGSPGFCDTNDVPSGLYFDYAQTGVMQAITSSGYFCWNGQKYEKQPVFGFSDGGVYGGYIGDANMDGLPDVLGSTGRTSGSQDNYEIEVAINQGDGEFEKKKASFTFSSLPNGGTPSFTAPVDFDNDGCVEYIIGSDLYTNGMTGMSQALPLDLGDEKLDRIAKYAMADFDRDGRIDLYATVKDANGGYKPVLVFNEGGGKCSVAELPAGIDARDNWKAYDVDGDGFMDLVYIDTSWNQYKILRNLGGRRFADQVEDTDLCLIPLDVDLDGRADYEDKNGNFVVSNHGTPLVVPNAAGIQIARNGGWQYADIDCDGVPDCLGANQYDYWADAFLRIANVNTPPTAPVTVMATQTEDEVVVSWDGATDKESTAGQLRYNISIKEKGATGDNAYVWSPLNATSDKALMTETLGYLTHYRQATRLPMPVERFQAGKTYEICVQTIDPWAASSPFSKVIEFKPQAECHIVLPEKGGVGEYIPYRTVNNVKGSLAIRKADGMDLSRDNHILWNTPGLKTVTTTNTGSLKESTTQILIVDRPDLSVQVPAKVLAGQTLVLDMPECMRNEGAKATVTSAEAHVAYDANSNQAVVAIPDDATRCTLTLSYADDVWTKAVTRDYTLTVTGQGWRPQIAEVKVEGTHAAVTWDAQQTLPATELFTGKVNVYREGNVTDAYELVGQADLSEGEFVDMESRADVRSYRYLLTLPTIYGVESVPSQAHATVHVMANRGMANDINLRWTPYEGADIAQYVVYAGSSPEDLRVVERLPGTARSYVHHRTSGDVTYYAIGFVQKVARGAKAKGAARSGETKVSNVISSADAYDVNAVTAIEIVTMEEVDDFTEALTALHLRAYVTPVQATIGAVEWSILSGEATATLSAGGTLSVIPGSKGGDVVVQAKATDGSGVTATRTFNVPVNVGVDAMIDESEPVRISASVGKVMVSNVHKPMPMLVTSLSGTPVCSVTVSSDHSVSLPAGLYVVKVGNTVRKVMVK